MDVTAIRRIAKARWWILVAAAILAVVVATRVAEYQEDNVPTHEAIATITFTEDPTTTDRGDFEEFLDGQVALAQDVNSDVLGETPGAFLPWTLAEVELEFDQNLISFIGRGYTQDQANELVDTMQSRFLAISTVGAGSERLNQDLDDLTGEIVALQRDIAQREAATPPTAEELEGQTRRSALESRLLALQNQYGALGVELLNPVTRSAGEVQAEMDRVLNDMIRMQLELADMPAAPEETPVPNEQSLLDDLRLQQLQARWQQLYAQQDALDGLATESDVSPRPVTVSAESAASNQALALVGAAIVALMALVGFERTRGMVWSASSLEGDVGALAELPPRGARPFVRPTDDPWYLSVPGGRRKAAIQLIRSQLDNFQNKVVAFNGVGVLDDETLDLTADIAMSSAVSGRNVLLIDASFSEKNNLVEFGSPSDVSLVRLLTAGSADPQEAMAEMKTALLTQDENHRELRTLHCGSGYFDAGDALAGQRFEMLLEVAREHFDLVIVAGANFGEPTSYILAQRVDYGILVGSIGHTVDRDLEAAERDFRVRRAQLLGTVMVRRRRSRLARWFLPRLRRGIWKSLDAVRPIGGRVSSALGMSDRSDDSEGEVGRFQSTLDRFRTSKEVDDDPDHDS